MQEGEKEVGENGCWLEPTGGTGLALEDWGSRDPVYSHRAAEPWPIPFTFGPTSLCNVSKPRRVEQSGEKHGDSENI